MYTKWQLAALNIIKENLSDSFKEVESMAYSNDLKAKSVFSEIGLKFFAKIDEKDVITIIVKDIEGIIIYEEETKNYKQFLELFYIPLSK